MSLWTASFSLKRAFSVSLISLSFSASNSSRAISVYSLPSIPSSLFISPSIPSIPSSLFISPSIPSIPSFLTVLVPVPVPVPVPILLFTCAFTGSLSNSSNGIYFSPRILVPSSSLSSFTINTGVSGNFILNCLICS